MDVVKTEKTGEMETLLNQFSELGKQITFKMFMKLYDNIKAGHHKFPKDEFTRLVMKTLNENKFQIDIKIQTPKQRASDGNTCEKVLEGGKNRGNKCSFAKALGSDYCTRHKKQILKESKNTSSHQAQINQYLGILKLQPKVSDKSPAPLKLRQSKTDEKMYLEADTNIMFRLNEKNEYVAFGVYVEEQGSKGIAKLSEDERIICARNSWKYEE